MIHFLDPNASNTFYKDINKLLELLKIILHPLLSQYMIPECMKCTISCPDILHCQYTETRLHVYTTINISIVINICSERVDMSAQ